MALSDESDLPEEYMEVYYSTLAQFEIYQESYTDAASYLDQALQQKGLSKAEKIRYTYVLAQLYEEAGDNELALEGYKQVTRYNPPYEMAFNARVSMAEVFEAGSASSEDLKKLLNKMLRDSKNKEYKDQIYFALGNIAWEEGNEKLAIEYYQLSVSSSMQNRHQKGLSSVTLAEIFYEQPDYILSAAYYDSAVSFLRDDYPDMSGLRTRASSLGDLVYYVNSYSLEDSLQMLASLPEAERFSIIDGIIEEVRKAEEEARQAEIQAMQDMAFDQSMMYNNQNQNQGQQQGGTWYFYNLNAKSFGQPEFRMKWGDRQLEDNWRRANKQTLTTGARGGDKAEGDSTDTGTPIFDNKSREFYLASIPLSDSAMDESNRRLELALFNMGSIYKENLLDYQEAISSFEEELQRFPHPDGNFNPQVMYYLYDLYNSTQKPDRAQFYKGQLARLYPDSHYTKLLNNPNYIRELEEEEMKVTRIYEDVFGHYQEKEYAEVIFKADSALALYPEDPLAPKFKYIKALSVGATAGKQDMKVELDSLIAQHPESEEGLQARELVDYMFEAFPVIREAEDARVAEEIYTDYDSSQEHYLLIALPASRDVNQVSFDLLNFNLDHFNEYDLNIEKLALSDGWSLVVVQTFFNAEGARRYLEQVEASRDAIFGDIPSSDYRMMMISLDNYNILSSEKMQNPYYLFYQKHYLNQE
jgi:tetratricopeptide (TPR) repeat protein